MKPRENFAEIIQEIWNIWMQQIKFGMKRFIGMMQKVFGIPYIITYQMITYELSCSFTRIVFTGGAYQAAPGSFLDWNIPILLLVSVSSSVSDDNYYSGFLIFFS